MRVISGTSRGRRLKGPAGTFTRPMADKIKEALFSSLASLGVEPDRVLDLYAGTGSVGIEALSRGALWADLVDQHPRACAVISANLADTGFASQARVHKTSVGAFLARHEPPYDLVIVDPPYADPDISAVLAQLAASALVQSGTFVAFGHSPRVRVDAEIGRMYRLKERCHGDSCFSIFEIDGRESEPDVESPMVESKEQSET